jgi:hypothetical protein
MKTKIFHIGSQVAVLDDTIKGIVISANNNEITLEDENGFLFKYHPSELIKTENHNFFDEQKTEEILLKVKQQSNKKNETKKKKTSNKKTELLEVDLHIHQITHSNRNMSNFNMLSLQLDTAKQKLQYAIKSKIKRVVFIHGVGQGVLKTELYKLLKKYPVEINDASYQKYGFGATEVYIFKNTKINSQK